MSLRFLKQTPILETPDAMLANSHIDVQRVMEVISNAGVDEITRSDLTRRTQFLDRYRRERAIAVLIRKGLITATKRRTATKTTTVLRLVESLDTQSGVANTSKAQHALGVPEVLTILALDLGQKTGWAIRGSDDRITSGTALFRPGRFESAGMSYLRFRQWLSEVKQAADDLDLIVFEEVRAHKGTTAAQVYGAFLGQLTAWAEQQGIPYEGVPVGTIKRHVTGKGNASKAAVIAAIKARGFNPVDDNEADALAILLWALEARGGAQ